MRETVNISASVEVLQANLESVARVAEWADKMGYKCPKKFARKFTRHFGTRPQTCLKRVRLESILSDLRNSNVSNFEIARKHSIPDEIALNKFVNYHLDCSPTDVKNMSDKQLEKKVESVGSKFG